MRVTVPLAPVPPWPAQWAEVREGADDCPQQHRQHRNGDRSGGPGNGSAATFAGWLGRRAGLSILRGRSWANLVQGSGRRSQQAQAPASVVALRDKQGPHFPCSMSHSQIVVLSTQNMELQNRSVSCAFST